MAVELDRRVRKRSLGMRKRRPRVLLDLEDIAAAIAQELGLAIDPRKLRTTQLVQMLNSTPLGEVVTARRIHQHRARAGLRIGDGKTVDLLRYAAWLKREAAAVKAAATPAGGALTGYEAHKERMRARLAGLSKSGRDIGELPPVVNRRRRKRSERSLKRFCQTYFKQTFQLKWSDDHLKVIAKIETAVLEGGLFAMAMPRGSGKTSLCEAACVWAILHGHRGFVALIGSDESHVMDMLDSIKTEFENNDLLLEDFPDVVYPIQRLEGIHQRAGGQLYQGELTHIGWTAKEIVLPTLPGSKASGAIIRVAGITGRIRGMKHKRVDGTSVRPSLVLVDDPQTDESAHSPSQCETRERILAGAILGLSGPGRKIAGLMTVTVVRPGDMADRILDREKHPQWQGERTRMVYEFPTNEKLWEEYAQIRAAGLAAGDGIKAATKFYRRNRRAMDAGAKVAWKWRFNSDELSAIQNAMNLKLQDEIAFWSEYQNDPLPEQELDADELTPDQIAAKTNSHAPGEVPFSCTRLTAFIDVQKKSLFWVVIGWEEDFSGFVVGYGTEPDQKRPYFTLRDMRKTLAMVSPRAGLEGAIYAGLERLTDALLGKEWRRDDGAMMRIDRCLVDANWGESTDVIYQFCRQSRQSALIMPSHGRYVGASSQPFSEYKRKRGDRVGLNWRIPIIRGKRSVRHVVYDTNYWKSFVHARLAVPMGDPGCLSLFGRAPERHRMISEHLTSEYRVKTEGRGRTVDEWKLRAGGPDNHLFDCVVGASVAASMHGAVLFGTSGSGRARKRIRLSDLQREKR